MIFLLSSIARFCMFSPNHLVPACCLLSLTHSTTLPSYHSWSSLTLTLLPSYVHCNLTCLPACLSTYLTACWHVQPYLRTYLFNLPSKYMRVPFHFNIGFPSGGGKETLHLLSQKARSLIYLPPSTLTCMRCYLISSLLYQYNCTFPLVFPYWFVSTFNTPPLVYHTVV